MRWLGRLLARLDGLRAGHWLIMRSLAAAIARRFDARSADGLHATLELAVRDPFGRPPERFTLAIAGPRCAVRRGAAGDAAARATVGSGDLLLLACGAVTWPQLFAAGRFDLSGDPFLALRFAALFRLPVALDGQ